MDPALAADRGSDEEPAGPLVEYLDLVVGLELADLLAADLIGLVVQPNEVVAHEAALDPRLACGGEGQLPGLAGDATRVAGRLERRPAPARHVGLVVGVVGRSRPRRDDGQDRRGSACGHRDRLGLIGATATLADDEEEPAEDGSAEDQRERDDGRSGATGRTDRVGTAEPGAAARSG